MTGTGQWQKFFLWRLPAAAIGIALLIEGAGHLLGGVTLHRHSIDDLANAVTHDEHAYPVVLLGDSVTNNVALKYRIGDPGVVADLATHAQAGLPSSLFLLERYLRSGHRPRHVILAASRDVYVVPIDKPTFKRYVTSVFTLPYERDFLTRYYPDYVDYRWRPAALSMDTRLVEPLISLARRPGNEIWVAPTAPAPNPQLERFSDEAEDPAVFKMKLASPDIVRPEARAILGEMCRLSRQYGFELHLVWPPMQAQLHERLQARGSLQRINTQLADIARESHTTMSIDDSGAEREYPYFDGGLLHIKGAGWEQLYALQLGAYVRRFAGLATAAASH
jgi:hypothetical protein